MMKDASVIFDLDGTMIDTAPDLIAATNYALCQFGKPPVPEHFIEAAVGLGAKAMIHAALLSLGHEPSAEELKTIMPHFLDYYGDHLAERSTPFPGLEDALARLRAEGALLGVCTNKLSTLARKLLAELNLEHYFVFVAGADSFPVRKPDPGHLLATIEAVGGDARRAVMIGDSSADSKAAHAAKVPFIAVTFGYGEKPVELLRPDAVIGHFSELSAALRSIPSLNGLAA
jgi:phosphoglycolate phosphatase